MDPADHDDQNSFDDNPSYTTPQGVSQTKSPLLDLPAELRLQIYNHAADFDLGSSKVDIRGGRSRFRVDWTAKSLPPSQNTRSSYSLLAACQTIRRELLPIFLRGYIVKFPCWDPGFKLQCLYWIEDVSESFINNIDFIWLEGVYWRISIRLGKSFVDVKEDGRATREDCHQYQRMQEMAYARDGIEFLLKVEYAREEHTKCAARVVCEETKELLRKLLVKRGESRLGKVELALLIREVSLCGFEQLRSVRN
ncbi:hypothetical protein PRZ48_007261 [Zasmidium cellare]|uniref:Uncharacterized protein n=1 Tax=Zasmidium cellare TaxID=395010 RepID=A0ABR0EIV8_ZASCE|nr:hypothetical protein PRZ48_007261 [Zasmidium cellare]